MESKLCILYVSNLSHFARLEGFLSDFTLPILLHLASIIKFSHGRLTEKESCPLNLFDKSDFIWIYNLKMLSLQWKQCYCTKWWKLLNSFHIYFEYLRCRIWNKWNSVTAAYSLAITSIVGEIAQTLENNNKYLLMYKIGLRHF